MRAVRRIRAATVALCLALALLSGAARAQGIEPASDPQIDPGIAVDTPAPGFTLRDQDGRRRSLGQLRGKVVLLAFVDTKCTSICPLTSESMVQALRLLGPAALRVQLVGIDANPLAASVRDVAAYTHAHHMQGRWWFLTGPRSRLTRIWRAYGVYVAAVHGDIDHQPLVVLIDTRGRERRRYFTQMNYGGLSEQAEVLAEGIAQMLPGRPRIRHEVSLQYLPPLGPDAPVPLTAFGRSGTPLVLGPAQPHLVLFFASWLDGAGLRAKLAVLDRYRALARRRGWPEPVAIDELPTEAPTAAWREQMNRLADTLRTPLLTDPSGRVADGYGVHDLPWVALTASGRVLWHHDGWLSSSLIATLARAASPVPAGSSSPR